MLKFGEPSPGTIPPVAPPHSFGLKFYAVCVSLSLLVLVGLLGLRAYTLASKHARETSGLISRDLSAQSVIQKMSSTLNGLTSARRKLAATGDSAYALIVERQEAALRSDADTLAEIYEPVAPEIAAQALDTHDERTLRALKSTLEERRARLLLDSEADARGLLLLIALSALLSITIAVGLGTLFILGLIRPMREIGEATQRIREGDFQHRLPAKRGVAELQQLSSSFNAMAERLESLDRAKTEFLATISHEIRNPLAALKEGLSLLTAQSDKLAPAARDRSLRACLIASKRVESMIDNLLELSDGRLKLFDGEMSRRDLRDAIQTAMDEIRPLADRKKISFRLNAPFAVETAFNWSGLVHVCENLFQNAVKYGTEGSLIEVGASKEEGAALVWIENEGRTIAVAEINRIFDMFFRGSDAVKDTRANGLGIGLNVVKRIIESHRGMVKATSDSGKTRFEFRIPLQSSPGLITHGAKPLTPAIVSVLAMIMLLGGASACSTFPGAPKKKPAAARKRIPPPVVEQERERSLQSIERRLWQMPASGLVEVPAPILRELLEERHRLTARVQGLQQELRALKIIDVEEAAPALEQNLEDEE